MSTQPTGSLEGSDEVIETGMTDPSESPEVEPVLIV
jgi:hypothetical protein